MSVHDKQSSDNELSLDPGEKLRREALAAGPLPNYTPPASIQRADAPSRDGSDNSDERNDRLANGKPPKSKFPLEATPGEPLEPPAPEFPHPMAA